MPRYAPHECAAPDCSNITTNEKYCSESCSGRGRALEKRDRWSRPKAEAKPATKPCPGPNCYGRGSWIAFTGKPNVNGESTPERVTCTTCGGSGKVRND